jgi:hypothetical protein
MLLAVNTGAVAIPLALEMAVAVVDPAKVALAPVAGVVKVTVMPLSGLLFASLRVACKAALNTDCTGALCGVPFVAEILIGMLLRLKLAGVLTPAALALTV